MPVTSTNESHFVRPPSVSRSNSQSSTDSVASLPRGMPIHSRRPFAPPPPLPPPQIIEELRQGHDVGYQFENNEDRNSDLPPIPEESSLSRGQFQRPRHQRHYKQHMDVDEESGRRMSVSTITRPAHLEGGVSAQAPKMARRTHSPTNSGNLLQGEFPLAQVSHDRSNRDYDHAILSKIGKPNSPPRHPRTDSSGSPVLAQKLSVQTQDIKVHRISGNEPSSALGSVAQMINSPSSTGASPATRYGWLEHNGLRSPPLDGVPSSSVLDPELFVQSSTQQRHAAITTGKSVDIENTPNRPPRNGYEHAIYPRADSETIEDPGLRPSSTEGHIVVRRASGTAMKRKALSPPGDHQLEERPRQDHYPYRVRVTSKSPNANYTSHNGSVSSATSSVQPPSYASSGPFSASSIALSNATGSLTSISSFDPNSPRDQSFYITSAGPVASPVSSLITRKGPEKLVPRKLTAQTTPMSPRPIPTRIGNSYICACCPKKPKKFETEEQLRAHENEKQYSCSYCHNRFKNKNEAERHQNSLHLRRHSWSCAALANFQAAFSPTGAADSSSTVRDACGYCGDEFDNLPAPDWDRRLEHLTNVHKFGECNSAKKFFRADHFRQHLKHSHAGRSGKWTNILEHACVRDEIPAEPAGFSATATAVDHSSVS